jgi:multidrug efflux pump subunit AcrA (membrane-fusion protein)
MKALRGFLGGLLALALVACGKSPEPPPAQPPPAAKVVVPALPPVPVEVPTLPVTIAAAKGVEEIPVVAKQEGFLLEQNYKGNPEVKSGDVLFTLDPHRVHDNAAGARRDDSGLIRITAPQDGVVGAARHGPGDLIEPGELLTTVDSIDVIDAEFSLAEDSKAGLVAYLEQLLTVPANGRVANFELFLQDGTAYERRGVIESVRHEGKSAIFTVRFPNPEHTVRIGFVRVRSTGGL